MVHEELEPGLIFWSGSARQVRFTLKNAVGIKLPPQRRQERKGLAAKTMLTCLVKAQIRRFFIQNLDFPLRLRVFAVEALFQLRFLG